MLNIKIRQLGFKLKYPVFLSWLVISAFILKKVDITILKTGIRSETDSTNIFPHLIAIGITTIRLDHVDVFGHTVEEIAWYKAGIFKSRSVISIIS